ncbi:hypothetical protein SOVF_213320 [Spinacia oleracea]|nr:hypothetical protein SOVF_213320 [Spinacia oleracea]
MGDAASSSVIPLALQWWFRNPFKDDDVGGCIHERGCKLTDAKVWKREAARFRQQLQLLEESDRKLIVTIAFILNVCWSIKGTRTF